MTPLFRASTPEDAEAIARFLQAVFGSDPREPYLQPDHMRWKYWQPRTDWPGSRSFVLEYGGSIGAHGAAWPTRILTPSGAVDAFFLFDWAADPNRPGAGFSLMRRMAETAGIVCGFGGSDAARRTRAAMGFRPHNEVQVFARPLKPFRQMVTHQDRSWKSPVRLARNLAWSLGRAAAMAGWSAREIDPQSAGSIAVPFPEPSGNRCVFEQSGERLAYLRACPTAESRLYAVFIQDRITGYFFLTFVPGQARVSDAWLETDDVNRWGNLYRLAAQAASAHPDANEVVAYAATPAAIGGIPAAGFHKRASDNVLLYDPESRIPADADLHLQMVHGDMAFWHMGKAEYLT
jgi:hypothetical protein